MITKEQAMTALTFHYTGRHPCARTVGPRGGVTESITVCRRNGATKTWKKDAARFEVPVKTGFRTCGVITDINAWHWHTEADCPLTHQT